jgi:hypothetical protein
MCNLSSYNIDSFIVAIIANLLSRSLCGYIIW